MTDDTKRGVSRYCVECERLQRELDAERLALKLACGESVDLRAERDELQRELDELQEKFTDVSFERDRLVSANDTLVARIEDLTEGYALEDTCPRVQCRTTSKRLRAERDELAAKVERLERIIMDVRTSTQNRMVDLEAGVCHPERVEEARRWKHHVWSMTDAYREATDD